MYMKWKPLPGRVQVLHDMQGRQFDRIVTEGMGAHTLLSTGTTYADVFSAQMAGEKRQRDLFNVRIP